MTETEKKEIAEGFITGLSNRDANLLKSIMTDDVVWSLPGKSLMSGEAYGVDAILKRSETLRRYEVKIELEHVVFGYQDVALHLHDSAKRGDQILDPYLTTVCSLRGYMIRRLHTFISDVEMLNA